MGETLVIVTICAAVIAIALRYSPLHARLKRELRAAPTVKIGELAQGQTARVVGRAHRLDSDLVAPLTGRTCVYYVVRVDREVGDDGWQQVIYEEQGVPFVVEDDTGRAIVEVYGAQMALDFDSRDRTGTWNAPDETQAALLAKYGEPERGLVFRARHRYREAVIEIGETVAVLGSSKRERDPTGLPGGYRDAQPTLVRLQAAIISDDPATTR